MLERIRNTKDKGFTLIELLIVIVILGILAAIVVFAVSSTRKDSVQASCKTDVKSVQLAAEAYKTKNGKYATAETDLLDANGGLLQAWPDSKEYTLTYSSTDGSAYSISGSGNIKAASDLSNTSTSQNVTDFCAGS